MKGVSMMKTIARGVVLVLAGVVVAGCARRDPAEKTDQATTTSLSAPTARGSGASAATASAFARLPKPTAEQAAETPVSFSPLLKTFAAGTKLACPAGAVTYEHSDERGASLSCGKPAQGNRYYDPSRRSGPALHFHKNGRLASQISYQDGKAEGPSARFDEDGNMTSFWTYKNGVEEGLHASFSSSDHKRTAEATYKNGKLDGIQKLWSDGELIAIIEYRDGAVTSETKFDHRLRVMTEDERRDQKKKLDDLLAKQRRLLEEMEQNHPANKSRVP